MELDDLAAHLQIRNLAAAYANHADEGRFGELVALFAPDGALEVDGVTRVEGRDAIAAFFDRARTHLAGAPAAPRIRHHVSSQYVRLGVDGPGTARSQCYWAAYMDGGVDHWGRYRDRLVCRDGEWLLAERRIYRDGTVPGGWGDRRDEWVAPPDGTGTVHTEGAT